MYERSWKYWAVFITGIVLLLLPYTGFPKPFKDVATVVLALLLIAVGARFLWPAPRRKARHYRKTRQAVTPHEHELPAATTPHTHGPSTENA